MRKKLGNINKVSVFCPQEITKSRKLAADLNKSGHDIENLEAYAFAYVAKKFKIPILSLFGLTNKVGPNAHRDWKKNEAMICAAMAEKIKTLDL